MARPGFVLEVDERTPPLVIPDGDGFRLERLPLGSRVIYPAESLPAIADLGEAIDRALDQPLDSEPLDARLRAGMRLTVVFDDISTPIPSMRRPDVRGTIIEAVLTRAARAGVDDVALVAATGLDRRMTADELEQVLGERVFRSFYGDGRLTNHDAEDPEAGAFNARAAASDLVVFVHLVSGPRATGAGVLAAGLGSTATISALVTGPDEDAQPIPVPVFEIDAVLDLDAFTAPWEFLTKREWEWRLRDQATWAGLRRVLTVASPRGRRRLAGRALSDYHATLVVAGAPEAVGAASREQVLAQQVVEVDGQADVGIIGVGARSPYSVDSVLNPVLAAWMGLAATFGAHTGRPVVRDGGALILYHPLTPDFSPLHHPSYGDFFADVLPVTADAARIAAEFEAKFATDPWYIHLYRTSQAFHGVHPIHRWYELSRAQQGCADIVWVGADRASAQRLGFRAASTLADALEIVASTVGRSPTISYLHTPPSLVAAVT